MSLFLWKLTCPSSLSGLNQIYNGHFPKWSVFFWVSPSAWSSWFVMCYGLPPFSTILIHFLAFKVLSWTSAFFGVPSQKQTSLPSLDLLQYQLYAAQDFLWWLDQPRPRSIYFLALTDNITRQKLSDSVFGSPLLWTLKHQFLNYFTDL